jgi:acyl dehydratase
VHVQSTARKNVGERSESVVMTWQRKVQVYKQDESAKVSEGDVAPDAVACELWLPSYDARRDYRSLAHLSNGDTYFEDFEAGTRIEHSRGRTITSEHIHLTAILDNTSQVHCNQHMIDQNPEQYVGGQLIIFGGIPFVLCLGLSCPDIADNALGDLLYETGKHTAPLFAGDTVFAATEILGKRDLPGRPDLGVLETRLFGFKPKAKQSAERVQIFELDREIAVKRRSHYA